MINRFLILSVILFLMACSKNSGSGSSAGFPNVLELGEKVIPQISNSRFQTARANPFPLLSRAVTYDGSTTDFSNQLDAIKEVFGNNTNGVNTQVIVQMRLANGAISSGAEKYLNADGTFKNCDSSISSTETAFGAPFFKDSTEPIFFQSTDYELSANYDSGKYSCFATWVASDTDYAIALGREAITSPPADCTDAFKYYIMVGYSTPVGAATGHQIQKVYYDGCEETIAIATHIGTSVTITGSSGGSSLGFNGRFELIGNVSDRSFNLRVGKMDVYADGSTTTNLIEASGIAKPEEGSSTNAHFILRMANMCNEDAACGSPFDKTFCISSGLEDALSVETDTTQCTSYETDFVDLEPFDYVGIVGANGSGHSELSSTGITMNAAAFGL